MHNDYPLLDVFLSLLYLFIWILWIFLLVRILTDVFRSPDLSGLAKGSWVVLLILLPFIGVLAYVIFRGASMHTREDRQFTVNQDVLHHYLQHAAGGSSTADELTKLAALRDQGVLTPEEFAAQKARLLV